MPITGVLYRSNKTVTISSVESTDFGNRLVRKVSTRFELKSQLGCRSLCFFQKLNLEKYNRDVPKILVTKIVLEGLKNLKNKKKLKWPKCKVYKLF